MVDYVLEGPKWGFTGLGTEGGIVTWAVDGTIPAAFLSDITAAFADWATYGDIQFQQVVSTAGADIDFTMGSIDGLDNILAQTSFSYSGSSFTSAGIEFDSGEGWHTSGTQILSNDNINLFVVALHEIGHAIGLDHYNAAPAIMNAYLDRSVTDLKQSDIDGVQALYGLNFPTTQASLSFGEAAPDVNGDAKSDVTWRSTGGDVAIWENIGAGTHGGESLGNVGTNWSVVGSGLFDGDTKSDLLWRSSSGDVVTWDHIANGTHGGTSLGNVGTNWQIAATADFGGDGQTDILWRSTSGDVVVWDNIANGAHGGATLGNVGLGWDIAATGDFDGDHKADILWRSTSGDLVTWENINNGTHGGESLGPAPLNTHVAGVGDFDGDGKADILWRANNGDTFIWNNISGTSHTVEFLGNVGLNWQVQNVGDYNGDAKADILWRSDAGDVVTWENISGGSHGGESLGNVGLSWNIQQHHYDVV